MPANTSAKYWIFLVVFKRKQLKCFVPIVSIIRRSNKTTQFSLQSFNLVYLFVLAEKKTTKRHSQFFTGPREKRKIFSQWQNKLGTPNPSKFETEKRIEKLCFELIHFQLSYRPKFGKNYNCLAKKKATTITSNHQLSNIVAKH